MKRIEPDISSDAAPKTELATLCAHARTRLPAGPPPLIAPIYQTSVGRLESLEQCEAVYQGRLEGHLYTRDSNANHQALEGLIAGLEGSEAALVLSSGMGAIAVALLTMCRTGDRVLASDRLYGATTALLRDELPRFGIRARFLPLESPGPLEEALREPAAALLVETLNNPLVGLADLPELAARCRQRGTRLIVDNTFAPCIVRPLELGADVVMHSLTKLIGGHSDVTLGALAGDAEFILAARQRARVWGLPANPFDSWLAMRGAATLPLRAERSAENAGQIALYLEDHPAVGAVYYPGLPSHPQHERCRELLANPGAMLSFELEDAAAVDRFIRRLRLIPFAPSLGDTATTLSYPAATSHRALSAEQREALGIRAGLVRLSVGIDAAADVVADLEQALRTTGGG